MMTKNAHFFSLIFPLFLLVFNACTARHTPGQRAETQAAKPEDPVSDNSPPSLKYIGPTLPLRILETPCEKKSECSQFFLGQLRNNPYSSSLPLEIHQAPFSEEKQTLPAHERFEMIGMRSYATQSTPLEITENDKKVGRCFGMSPELITGEKLYPLSSPYDKDDFFVRRFRALTRLYPARLETQIECQWLKGEMPPQYANQLWYRLLYKQKSYWWSPPKDCLYQEKDCAILKSEAPQEISKSPSTPSLPYEFPFGCEGESCGSHFLSDFYTDHISSAEKEIPVFAAPFSKKQIGKIKNGEIIDLIGFTLYSLKAAPYLLTKNDMAHDKCDFENAKKKPEAGNTVYILAYDGEGWWKAWYQGEIGLCDFHEGYEKVDGHYKTQQWSRVLVKEGAGWIKVN